MTTPTRISLVCLLLLWGCDEGPPAAKTMEPPTVTATSPATSARTPERTTTPTPTTITPTTTTTLTATTPSVTDTTPTTTTPTTTTNTTPTTAETTGIQLTSTTLATGVEGRQPVDPKTQFSRESDTRAYVHIRLTNPTRTETTLGVAWVERGEPVPDRRTELRVPPSRDYVTWAYTAVRRRPGSYDCIVTTADGQELTRLPFEVVE